MVDLRRTLLTQNRAEEYGQELWEYFVIPPYFDRLDLQTARKPRLIIGGRGCGKTMLLRYLSHESAFSPRRSEIPSGAAAHIGLYWRTDTQFANAMQKRSVEHDVWESAFNHYVAIVLSLEVLSSLESIARSDYPGVDDSDLENVNYEPLRAFEPTLPSRHVELKTVITQRLWEFEAWVNDVRKKQEPNFLPGPSFIGAVIELARRGLAPLRDQPSTHT